MESKQETRDGVPVDKVLMALDRVRDKLKEMKDAQAGLSNEMQAELEALAFKSATAVSDPAAQQHHELKRARPSGPSDVMMKELALTSNYLLRTDRFSAFEMLCREAEVEFLGKDVVLFRAQAHVRAALLNGDADPALGWCLENRAGLKKYASSFEFDLRLKQFCDIVQRGQIQDAVHFARKYLAQNANEEKMRRAMAALVYPNEILSQPEYQHLLSADSWEVLADRFYQERDRVMGLCRVPPLDTVLRVGLAATRTKFCQPDGPGKASGCPCCQSILGQLAQTVPRTLRERSTLVCRISGQVMDDTLVLPNGQAYSRAALEKMAAQRNDGKVCCPVSKTEFFLKDAKRAFVL